MKTTTSQKSVKSTKPTLTTKAPKKSEAQVYDITGKATGVTALRPELFGAKDNDVLIAQYVRVYLANQRQGNAQVKTRGDVVGSTQKKWRQKGTGRARHGSGKSNIWRGGGVTFGPAKRDFNLKLNKKQKFQALQIALSQSAKQGAIAVIHTKGIGTKPQTKIIAAALEAMDIAHKKVLFISDNFKESVFVQSARNIPRVDIIQTHTINAYTVLNHDVIVFVDKGLETIVSHFIEKK